MTAAEQRHDSVPADVVGVRIPSELEHYWRAKDMPRVRRRHRVAKRVLGFDPLPTDDHARALARGYYQADPLADAFVEESYFRGGDQRGRAMIEQALAEGVGAVPHAPQSLVAMFEQINTEPDWLDWETVELGAKVFRCMGVAAIGISGAGEFLGFTENPGVKPLAFTGKFTGNTAHRRMLEVARFWIDTTDPGGMRRGGAGRATAVRVRMMHCFIRRRLMDHPDWDHAAWGRPISQSEMIGPALGTAVGPSLGGRALGFRMSRDDVDAAVHFWRYVAYVMGVDPPWFPADFREGVQYFGFHLLNQQFTGGDDCREIVESYLPAFAPKPGTSLRKRVRDELNYRFQIGYTRLLIPGLYRRYDMPNPWPWALLPMLQTPFNLVATTLVKHNDRADHAFDRFQRWRRETWWRNEMGDSR